MDLTFAFDFLLYRLAAHAQALQSFIEKVTIFKSASAYVDQDLTASAQQDTQTYRLAALYDRYHEYSELLAAQGLTSLAVKYAALTPVGYVPAGEGVSARERLQVLSGGAIKGRLLSFVPVSGEKELRD
jgi:protein transport protein SEC31